MTEQHTTIHLLAGQRQDGELVYEDIQAEAIGDGCYTLLQSPVFARGAARGDVVRLLSAGQYQVEQHNGNLCVRVFGRDSLATISQRLQALLQPLQAELDFQNERVLVYSVPVQAGFDKIEAAFNEALKGDNGAVWLYANVYDPVDGETPLNWWHDFLAK